MKSILKLISLFSPAERRNLIPLTIAVLVMALLDVAGIGSLAPFMAVVSNPDIIQTQPLLNTLYTIGGFSDSQQFEIALGLAVFLFVVIATVFKMFTYYGIYRYVGNRRYTIGLRLFRQYLFQPYSYFLDHNTSELSKNVLNEVDLVMGGLLLPAMDAFAKVVASAAILALLIAVNPLVAMAAFVFFGLLYAAIYVYVRPRLSQQGEELRESNRLRYKATSEAFGAIKDVKILGKEQSFSDLYSVGARRFASTQAANTILSQLPSFALQAVAIGFAVALVIIMLAIQGNLSQVLPLIALYAFAVQRLIPNLQGVFNGLAQVRYYGHAVDALHKDMSQVPSLSDIGVSLGTDPSGAHPFRKEIQLRSLSFSYPSSDSPVLREINLKIAKNTTVGFVGTTGCGKTTLVDVIMGLLEPTSGSILSDGIPITGTSTEGLIPAWQRNFGYVPQQIYLSDDTISANIAFGVPNAMLDANAVDHAARVANLRDFVMSELTNGYDTVVGERGVRLSGGQRQRIGIARALYHDPEILVMDEATSALDSVTEEAVMDAIQNLAHTKTIIIIAHRITTVKECDVICLLEKGRIVGCGRYDDLLRKNARFRAMAKIDTN